MASDPVKRIRDVAHLWSDKRILVFFRKNFDKNHYKNLRTVYLALCEIDSDFNETGQIIGFTKTVATYAGVHEDSVRLYLRALQKADLIDYWQENRQGKFGNTTLMLYKWEEGREEEVKSKMERVLNRKYRRRKSPGTVNNGAGNSGDFNNDLRSDISNNDLRSYQDISGEQSPPVDISNDSHEEKEKETVQPVDRNEEYMPFAKRLADIIRKKKRINKNSSIRSWADDFRKLVTIDLVEDDHEAKIARVNRALDWYEQNIGGKFVPDIQSGASFRQKLPNIENAIERQEKYAGRDTGTSAKQTSKGSAQSAPSKPVDNGLGPRPLFRKEFGNDLGDWLFENAFKPLKDVFSGPDGELLRGVTRSNLAQSIVHMLHQIQDRQKNLPPDFFDTHPYYGFMSILKAYVQHLEEARSWLDAPTLAMLDISHSIFGRFRKQYARDSDHLARDPFTGLPPSSV